MAASYQTLAWTRPIRISLEAINLALRAGDPTAGVISITGDVVTVKSNAAWTPARITAAQAILDTVQEPTVQVVAQRAIDTYPIELRALVLALIDQINVLRAGLPVPLAAITPAQAIAAIRAKAGTLT